MVVTCSHVTYVRLSTCTTGIPLQNNSINRYGNPNATRGFFWREIAWPPASCKAEIIKQSIKTRRKTDIVSVSVLSKVLSLDYLSRPKIWKIEKEKNRESRRQASEAQREIERQRARARDKKQQQKQQQQTKETNFHGRTT